MSPHPTIFALSSGRLPAAIAVVRISGPRAGDALKALSGKIPEPRKAAFARVRDPASGELIDEALALWFPGPNSETGEDTAELQLHGGRAVVAATFRALAAMEGLRPAEAGEFTRRAFENGKLDLTAVEGLAELVGAETEAQRRQAFRQMQGVLGKRADAWREKLIKALAQVEAGIDFSDEGDVPDDLAAPAVAIARELEAEISAALSDAHRGERLREGMVVAIAGPPNAGKSTLLNRLANREAAIVSPYAGTTRDVIEVHLDLNGLPVTLLDTAGIRDTDDPVEMEGVRRARERAAAADLVLWVVDASEGGATVDVGRPKAEGGHLPAGGKAIGAAGKQGYAAGSGAFPAAEAAGTSATALAGRKNPPVWLIRNKADLLPEPSRLPSDEPQASGFSDNREEALGLREDRSSGSRKDRQQTSAFREDGEEASHTRIDIAHASGLLKEHHSAGAHGSGPANIAPRANVAPRADVVAGDDRRSAGESSFGAILQLSNNDNKDSFIHNNNESIDDIIGYCFTVSSKTGAGLKDLVGALASTADGVLGATEPSLVTRERHRLALQHAQAALWRSFARPLADDLLAEELRLAARALERLTGRVDVEDVLDVIFRDFCIGK